MTKQCLCYRGLEVLHSDSMLHSRSASCRPLSGQALLAAEATLVGLRRSKWLKLGSNPALICGCGLEGRPFWHSLPMQPTE